MEPNPLTETEFPLLGTHAGSRKGSKVIRISHATDDQTDDRA